MKVIKTSLDGIVVIEPDIYSDVRGFFLETYQQQRYAINGMPPAFVQDNLSYSVKDTLRGLHFQYPHTQAKLVQVLQGEVFDVAVDVRLGSPSFKKWFGVCLNGESKHQLFIPEGFAHGFVVMSESAVFTYKCSDYYHPECEQGIIWNDSDIHIDWPIETPLLSDKDLSFSCLKDVSAGELPTYGA